MCHGYFGSYVPLRIRIFHGPPSQIGMDSHFQQPPKVIEVAAPPQVTEVVPHPQHQKCCCSRTGILDCQLSCTANDTPYLHGQEDQDPLLKDHLDQNTAVETIGGHLWTLEELHTLQ